MGPAREAGTSSNDLVLGPLLRYCDLRSAAVWVETGAACRVTVRTGLGEWSARTFAVHGHHYALVECDGLRPGTLAEYTVLLDDVEVWPPVEHGGFSLPSPVISTLPEDRRPRLAFGSCRTSVTHDRVSNLTHGVDALRAYALALAGATESREELERPDLMLFLGDQVYADETTEQMQEFIASRRDIDEPPGEELADYEEYAHLYRLAWNDPVNRWLLSTVPSAMIFDDHDVRDDWNTSWRWRQQMESTEWWHGRIVSALASYWVYQHLGNLTPQERAEDEIWQQVAAHPEDAPELDLSDVIDAFAERVDQRPETYRWSFARELGGSRLVVVDSRAARVLEADRRSMLDPDETAWLDEHMRGDCEHLLVGTSLPFLLPEPLHHLEGFSEALAEGAWGRRWRRVGERLRQAVDLEHWGAFQSGFRDVAAMSIEVARGRRGVAPRTVTFLSGDVHHSYVARVRDEPGSSTVAQAVCSPIRNPLPRVMRFATAAAAYGLARPVGHLAARSAKVPEPPFRWDLVQGPWFDNNLATMQVGAETLDLHWYTGDVEDERHERPVLRRVASVVVGENARVESR